MVKNRVHDVEFEPTTKLRTACIVTTSPLEACESHLYPKSKGFSSLLLLLQLFRKYQQGAGCDNAAPPSPHIHLDKLRLVGDELGRLLSVRGRAGAAVVDVGHEVADLLAALVGDGDVIGGARVGPRLPTGGCRLCVAAKSANCSGCG